MKMLKYQIFKSGLLINQGESDGIVVMQDRSKYIWRISIATHGHVLMEILDQKGNVINQGVTNWDEVFQQTTPKSIITNEN